MEAVLAGYLRRAAELATLSSGARRAFELQRELGVPDLASIPDDREPGASAGPNVAMTRSPGARVPPGKPTG